jgi:hypothetical protein
MESPKLSLFQSLDQLTCSPLNGSLELETRVLDFNYAIGSNAGDYVIAIERITGAGNKGPRLELRD